MIYIIDPNKDDNNNNKKKDTNCTGKYNVSLLFARFLRAHACGVVFTS